MEGVALNAYINTPKHADLDRFIQNNYLINKIKKYFVGFFTMLKNQWVNKPEL